ncbi:MAG: hypothetical protein PHN41_06985 [Bacteroidales bacterium]|nr:hypothetical protein [Bacteroidales bacterium]
MAKLKLSLFLLVCILATSFVPSYAGNDLVFNTNFSELSFNELNSLNAPKRRPVKRGRRGKKGNEYAFTKGKIAIDAGVGFPMLAVFPTLSMKLPALSLAGDYCFFSGGRIALSAGITGSYSQMTERQSLGGMSLLDSNSTPKDFGTYYAGGKFTFTINFSKSVLMYYNISLGYLNMDLATPDSETFHYSGFMGTLMMGFKFYFTKNIGAFIEWGFDVNKVGAAGIALKF